LAEHDQYDAGASGPSRKRFLQTSAGVAAGAAGTLILGPRGAMAERVGTPMRAVTVKYMGLYWLDPEIKQNRQLVDAFNKQSKSVRIEYVQSSWSAIANQMTVAFSSGSAPDVFQYYDAGLIPWGRNGLVVDLRSLLPKSAWSSVNPGTLSALTNPNGAVIGYPYETEVPLIYYNVDMFNQAGIQPATVAKPWTWDQLAAAARKLSQPAKHKFGIVADWQSSQLLYKSGLGWQAGSAPIHYSNGNYKIDAGDSGTRAAVGFVASLFKSKSADLGTIGADPAATFLKGSTGMLIVGAWERSVLPAAPPKPGAKTVNWAAMPMVKGKVDNFGSGAAQTLSIAASSKNKEAAAEFIAWWGQPGNVAAMCGSSDQIPPNQHSVALLRQRFGTSDYWDIALAEAKSLRGQPYCPGFLAMLGKNWDPAMYDVFRGKLTVDQFVAKVNGPATDYVQTAAGND
jgi:multiple sugar transport system substrate-binding protein